MDFRSLLIFYLELLFSLALLWKEGLLTGRRRLGIVLFFTAAVFVLRYFFMDYETLDYQDWISRWIGYFREGGFWKTLGTELWACNYNVPYLYFLSLISLSSIYDLYLVKLLSIFFDILLAYWTMKLISLYTESESRRLVAFIGTLWLPTVFLNGAVWGQCDSIYVSFAVLSFYLALSDRPIGSMIAIAVSFSIKLQAIFIMPVYLILIFAKKIKVWHLAVFPVTYVLTILPAVIAGRNFLDLLLLYYNNTDSIGEGLNYNSSSLYSITEMTAVSTTTAAAIGIGLAFALCFATFAWFFIKRKQINNRALLGAALIFCIGVPFLLPHMHDRYFFLADILTFALAVISPWDAIVPVLVSFGSLLGYHAYLKMRYLLPMRYGGLAMAFALLLTIIFTAAQLTECPRTIEAFLSDKNPEVEK